MEISFRFEGFEEVQRGVEALSSSAEIGAINKKIFQRSADITEPKMKAHMARSLTIRSQDGMDTDRRDMRGTTFLRR